MKRHYMIGLMAVLLAVFLATTPAGARFVHTARNFDRQFYSLRAARSINLVEKLVLSFMLAR